MIEEFDHERLLRRRHFLEDLGFPGGYSFYLSPTPLMGKRERLGNASIRLLRSFFKKRRLKDLNG
jgi:hypothetical protein